MYTQLHLQLYQSAYKVLGIVVCNKMHWIITKHDTKKIWIQSQKCLIYYFFLPHFKYLKRVNFKESVEKGFMEEIFKKNALETKRQPELFKSKLSK